MKFQIRASHYEVTEALQNYVEKKIGRLETHFQTPQNHVVSVKLSTVKDLHAVEVTMPLDGYVIRAEDKSTDMYASIDMVAEKLGRQIDKHKTKLNKRYRHEGLHALFVEGDAEAAADFEDQAGEVARVKKFAFKPMPVDEAILQMDLLGHDFFVFNNADTDEVNVVYKRTNGQYGLIEPAFA